MPADRAAGLGAGRCPICGAPPTPETKPFSSKRCRDVDLHRWLSGAYAMPAREDDDEADSPPLLPE